MRTLQDPARALTDGLAAIRTEFHVPESFSAPVLSAAEVAAKRRPSRHTDRSRTAFVTLDPASSTDLDQAFRIERSGSDLLLHYAIADVGWFVEDGDPIDEEAWKRGTTLYLPDGKAGLYPPVLSEGAASLLPNGPRPAVIFTMRVASDGGVVLDDAERAIIHSVAKLAYENVRDADLPEGFADLSDRIQAAEKRRGAARVDPPEQEVAATGEGRFELRFRRRMAAEANNAALSLAANMAVAAALQAHGTGLFRIMPEPDRQGVQRLRHTARALGVDWPADMALDELERGLTGATANEAALMMAIRRAGAGASYVPFRPGETPWHSAMAATYAHATAPLRRLADRYVVRAALAIANGEQVPGAVTEAFERLPQVMARADVKGGQIERAVVDLAEAVMLQGREGELFRAVVTNVDERGARIQLHDQPIVARLDGRDLAPGEELRLKLTAAEPARRAIGFELAG